VSEETDLAGRRAAYAQAVLALHGRTRNFAFVVCLLGVLALVASRYIWRAPMWTSFLAVGVIAAGWAMFVFVVLRRIAWVRAHPFDAGG
jgi:uncharacterized membrane protein (DUF2068 family)